MNENEINLTCRERNPIQQWLCVKLYKAKHILWLSKYYYVQRKLDTRIRIHIYKYTIYTVKLYNKPWCVTRRVILEDV